MTEFAEKIKRAPLGQTHLFSVGQAGFILKSSSGQLLAIDLYLSDCVERAEGHMGFKRMLPKLLPPEALTFDVIIATHAHRDHYDYDSMPALLQNEKTVLVASEGCRGYCTEQGLPQERIYYGAPGDHLQLGAFRIDLLPCDHGTAAPDAFGVLITVDGKRILETGDTCLRLDRTTIYRSYGEIDVLMAPINGRFGNMDAKDCAMLADALQPKLTIPCHYGMFASHFGQPGEFLTIMQEQYPETSFLILTQGEGIRLN